MISVATTPQTVSAVYESDAERWAAVAGRDRRAEMAAPVVVAKGRDYVALKIKELAREHGVPIVENKPLARALLKIEAYAKQVPMNVDPAHATAYIINPLIGQKVNFKNLFQTHPPTEDRVARLRHQHVH